MNITGISVILLSCLFVSFLFASRDIAKAFYFALICRLLFLVPTEGIDESPFRVSGG